MPALAWIICIIVSIFTSKIWSIAALHVNSYSSHTVPLQTCGVFALSLLISSLIARLILYNIGYTHPIDKGDNLPDGFWAVVSLLSGVFTLIIWVTRGFGIYDPLALIGIFFNRFIRFSIIGWIIVNLLNKSHM